jgi:DNA-binding HxlR family transcriptional regulator
VRTYGQYCPIARTAELFAERWTPIIVRNLAAGCTTFTQLREGAPGIPKALLANRLSQLERRGVLARTPRGAGRGSLYALTDSGYELKRVCDAMGEWGARWLELEPHHLDPAYVLWATCRLVDLDRIPPSGVVVRFDLRDERRRFWMLLHRPRVEMCTSYPGREEDLVVTADGATLALWNLRRITFDEAVRDGRFRIEGAPQLAKSFPTWMRPSPYAHVASARGSAAVTPRNRPRARGTLARATPRRHNSAKPSDS